VNRPLEFHWEVQPDLDSSFRFYERERAGLGTEFLDSVQFAFDEIVDHPTRYGFAKGDVREYAVTRFPYAIYYRVLNDRVRVLAVYHASRHPSGWQSRT